MLATKEDVLAGALALPRSEQLELIERLSENLDADGDDDVAAVDAAWRVEIGRRMAEIDAGRVEFFSWDEVRRRMSDGGDAKTA